MQEVLVYNSAASLCSLFVVILTCCEPSNPLDIYEHHKEFMTENHLYQQHTRFGKMELGFNKEIFTLPLNDIQDRVLSMEGR